MNVDVVGLRVDCGGRDPEPVTLTEPGNEKLFTSCTLVFSLFAFSIV